MEFYQWLVPLIGIFYTIRTIIQYRNDQRSASSLIIWLVFWFTVIVLAIIPNPVSFKVASLLGFKSNINAVIFVAIGWLFLLIFYLSSTIDRMEKQMTDLIREIAIRDAEKEATSSKAEQTDIYGEEKKT